MSALPDEGKSAAASGLVASQLTTLYTQYYTDVYAYCRRRLRNREEAEDATQVTFVKAFAAFRRGIVPDTEAAWLFTIAKRVVLTRLEVTNRLRAVETVTELDHFEAPGAVDRGELDELQRAVEALPETSRRAFVMREWQGMQYEEIADELGLQRSHVGVILLRARRQVVKQLRTALSFGPAPTFLRRALEMLSTDGAHMAAASAIAASAPVLVAVAPMAGGASAAAPTHTLTKGASRSALASAAPVDSRFTLHAVLERADRAAAAVIAAPVAMQVVVHTAPVAVQSPAPTPAPTPTVDPSAPGGVVDAVVPTPVEPQPQEPARTVASDSAPPDTTPRDPLENGPTIDAPVDEASDSPAQAPVDEGFDAPAQAPADPESPPADGGGSVAAPSSGVQPGQGQETADSTPGQTGTRPPQSAAATAPGHADAPNNGTGANSADNSANGNGHANDSGNAAGNGKGNGQANAPAATQPAEPAPPATDPPTPNGNRNAGGTGGGNAQANTPVSTPGADPGPPAADPPTTNGNGNGQSGTPVEPAATPPGDAGPPTPPANDNAGGNGNGNGNGRAQAPPAAPVVSPAPAPAPAPAPPNPGKGKK